MCVRQSLILFVALFFFAATAMSGVAPGEEPTPEDLIAQVLLNTQKRRAVDFAPTEAVVQGYRKGAQSTLGDSWGFTEQLKIDEKEAIKSHRITILPEDYSPDEADVEKWNKIKVPLEPEPDWEVAFRASGVGSVKRYQVTYRAVIGPYRLTMNMRVAGSATSTGAVANTRDQWEQFYDFAKDILGDQLDADIHVTVSEPISSEPDEIFDGDVINVDNDQSVDVDVDFDLWAVAEFLEPKEPYDLRLKVIKLRGGKGISVRGSSLGSADREGWRNLRIANPDSKGSLVVTMKKFDRAETVKGRPVTDRLVEIQVQLLAPKDDDAEEDAEGDNIAAEFRFGVQRRDWVPIVQRFQVIGRNYRARGPDGEVVSALVPRPERISFNDYLDAGGTLLQNYRSLVEPMATRFDAIKKEEPVCLGWRADNLDFKQATDFLVAVDDPEVEAKLPVLLRGVGVRHVIDIRLWRAPKITSLSPGDLGDLDELGDLGNLDDLGDLDDLDDADLLGDFDGLFIDPDEEELRLRNDVYIKSYSLTAVPIELTPRGEGEAEFLANLPERWRKKPMADDHQILLTIPGKFQKLEDHFPLAERYEDPRSIPDSATSTRISGVFQLRLRAEFFHVSSTERESKKVDVAIRYAVAPLGFNAHLLEWSQRRAKSIPGSN